MGTLPRSPWFAVRFGLQSKMMPRQAAAHSSVVQMMSVRVRVVVPKNQEGGGKKTPSLLVDCCEWWRAIQTCIPQHTHVHTQTHSAEWTGNSTHNTLMAGMGHAHTTPSKRKQGTQGAKYKDHKLI